MYSLSEIRRGYSFLPLWVRPEVFLRMRFKSELLACSCLGLVLAVMTFIFLWSCVPWGCAKPGNSEGIRTRSETHAWLGLCLAEGSQLSAELCVKGNQALSAGFTSVDPTRLEASKGGRLSALLD